MGENQNVLALLWFLCIWKAIKKEVAKKPWVEAVQFDCNLSDQKSANKLSFQTRWQNNGIESFVLLLACLRIRPILWLPLFTSLLTQVRYGPPLALLIEFCYSSERRSEQEKIESHGDRKVILNKRGMHCGAIGEQSGGSRCAIVHCASLGP